MFYQWIMSIVHVTSLVSNPVYAFYILFMLYFINLCSVTTFASKKYEVNDVISMSLMKRKKVFSNVACMYLYMYIHVQYIVFQASIEVKHAFIKKYMYMIYINFRRTCVRSHIILFTHVHVHFVIKGYRICINMYHR